jgi:hypothetical protein
VIRFRADLQDLVVVRARPPHVGSRRCRCIVPVGTVSR